MRDNFIRDPSNWKLVQTLNFSFPIFDWITFNRFLLGRLFFFLFSTKKNFSLVSFLLYLLLVFNVCFFFFLRVFNHSEKTLLDPDRKKRLKVPGLCSHDNETWRKRSRTLVVDGSSKCDRAKPLLRSIISSRIGELSPSTRGIVCNFNKHKTKKEHMHKHPIPFKLNKHSFTIIILEKLVQLFIVYRFNLFERKLN